MTQTHAAPPPVIHTFTHRRFDDEHNNLLQLIELQANILAAVGTWHSRPAEL